MSENFTTQATNTVSSLKTGVDPRTGQLTINFPIASLVANAQLGPNLDLTLSYSPLNTQNIGFGKGFTLGITRYDANTHTLQLSSGEQYKLIPGTTVIRNQKLNHFKLSFLNNSNPSSGYRIVWKDGKVEELSPITSQLFVLSRLISPLGHQLTLQWRWSGTDAELTRVKDDTRILCECDYSMNPKITFFPGTEEEHSINFMLVNRDQLVSLSRDVSETESLHWKFHYQLISKDLSVIDTVTYPTGMVVRATYSEIKGHIFPSQSTYKLQRLPVVISLYTDPGARGNTIIQNFSYTAKNFLGYLGNFGVWDENSDYIYKSLSDYNYGSTETIECNNDITKITRSYNNYHQQLTETMVRQQCTYHQEFEWYSQPGVFIESQPAQFQLLKKKTEIWTDEQSKKRTHITVSEFDEAGNPTLEISPDGTKTTYSWYSPQGESGAPAEPNGFTRLMKEKIITPRHTEYSSDTPVQRTLYTYKTLANNPNHIVQDQTSNYADSVLVNKTENSYITSGLEYGRVHITRTTIYDDKGTGYSSIQTFSTVRKDSRTVEKVDSVGFDELTFSYTRELSALTKLMYKEEDSNGLVITYTYDKLGRISSKTIAPKTSYEHVTKWSYGIENNVPYTLIEDPFNNQKRMNFDGLGRKVEELTYDRDNTQTWYHTSKVEYLHDKDPINVTTFDWDTKKNNTYVIVKKLSRDGWNSISKEIYSTGLERHTTSSPTLLQQSSYILGKKDSSTLQSGSDHRIHDPVSMQPVQSYRQDLENNKIVMQVSEWDGLKRLRKETDACGRVTKSSYDVYGRMIRQVHADGTIVEKTYAPHTTKELVTSIKITGQDRTGSTKTWVLGTQSFDSMNRLVQQTSYGRSTKYIYTDHSNYPSQIVLPSGKTVHYRYIKELGYVTKEISADGIVQEFSYDPKTGKCIKAAEGNTVNLYEYYPSGALKQETLKRG